MLSLTQSPPPRLAPLSRDELVSQWSGAEPVVSVLCATFNQQNFIEDAICGFLAQKTDFPFEIIIRDDGSSDRTAEIVADYAARYPGIIIPVFEAENTFLTTRPLTVLVGLARAQYLAICEGDDYWIDPWKLAKQKKFLDENEWCSIVHHDVTILDMESDGYGRGLQRHLAANDEWRTRERCPSLYFAAFGNYVMTCSIMLRSAAVDWNRFREAPRPGPGDIALVASASEHSDIGFQNFAGSAYRVSPSGFWTGMDPAERGVLATRMYRWLGSELAPGIGDLFRLRANFEELAVQHEVSREEKQRVLHRAEELEAEIARTRRSISSIITRMQQQADITATRLAQVTEQQSLLLDIESRERENVSLLLTDLETVLQETLHELAKSRHAYRRLVGRRSVRAALRVARFAQPLFRVVRRRRRIRSQHD